MIDRAGRLLGSVDGKPPTLAWMLQTRAQLSPDDIAFTAWSSGQAIDHLTYEQLYSAACAMAEQLIDHGCGGHPVILLHPPGLQFLIDFFACIYAGAAAVPLPMPVRTPDHDRFERVTRLIQPKLLIVSSEGVAESTFEQWSRSWPELPLLRSRRCAVAREPRAELRSDDSAVIQFTSGSSSAPRGAILSHAAVMANLGQIHQAFDFRAAERREAVALWLPHYHDMGLFGRLECIYAGCPGHIMSPLEFTRRPLRWLELVTRTKATVTGAPNFALELCAELAEADQPIDLDLSALRIAFCGAEPVNAGTLYRFEAAFRRFGLSSTALLPCYGLAEATLMVSSQIPGRDRHVITVDSDALERGCLRPVGSRSGRQLVSCGQVVSGMHVAIVDPRTRTELPPHSVGEIWISGPNVSCDQFGDDGRQNVLVATAEANGAAPRHLPTGDLGGFIDHDLFVIGRIKNTIIVHGRNLHPHDLERVVPDCHDVLKLSRTAAIAVDTPAGERPALIIEVRRDVERRTDELSEAAEAVAEELRRQFDTDPARVVIARRGAIAWTTSGKVAHAETASRLRRGDLQVLAEWPAASAKKTSPESVEDVIIDVVGSVLGRDVPPDSRFRELGGDSLAAHRAAARLRRCFGPAFQEHDFFMESLIEEISRLVDSRLIQYVENLSEQEVAAALQAIGYSAPQNLDRLPVSAMLISAEDGPSSSP
jgi:acyl-CoA synthetase (AMP-forming)/AMP-acid ligase II/acyl carrier protein